MGWECFCEVGFDLGPLLQGQTRILYLQYFFKYVLAYFLHLNNYLVTFLHNPICGAQLICPSVSFGISFEHAVQLPFTVLLYSTFPDNYAFLSLSPSQIKNTHSADTVPVHGHSTLVQYLISVKRQILRHITPKKNISVLISQRYCTCQHRRENRRRMEN